MSTFDKTKAEAGKKAEETKGLGQEKAGQAQSATGTAQSKAQGTFQQVGDTTADAAGAAKTKAGEAAGYAKSIAEDVLPKSKPEDATRLDYQFTHEINE